MIKGIVHAVILLVLAGVRCFSDCLTTDTERKPQLLLFSATIPFWVKDTARRYMAEDREWIDLIGQDKLRTAILVEVMSLHRKNDNN